MVDKKLAVELRKQGLSYKEIASRLGCSFGWCAKNLKGVEKEVDTAVDSLTKASAIAIVKEVLERLERL